MRINRSLGTFVALAILAAATCIAGCRGGPSNQRPETDADAFLSLPGVDAVYDVIDGPKDDAFPFVGCLRTEGGELIGTGVLIDPLTVLTVGHVADQNPVWFENGATISAVTRIACHPQYNPVPGLGVDLGICLLKDPVPCASYPAVNRALDLKRMDQLTTVGYSHLVKKASMPNVFLYFGNPTEESQALCLTTNVTTFWFGDSGGPILAWRNGGWTVYGLMSRMLIYDATVMDNVGQRVDVHIEWIEDNRAKAPAAAE